MNLLRSVHQDRRDGRIFACMPVVNSQSQSQAAVPDSPARINSKLSRFRDQSILRGEPGCLSDFFPTRREATTNYLIIANHLPVPKARF